MLNNFHRGQLCYSKKKLVFLSFVLQKVPIKSRWLRTYLLTADFVLGHRLSLLTDLLLWVERNCLLLFFLPASKKDALCAWKKRDFITCLVLSSEQPIPPCSSLAFSCSYCFPIAYEDTWLVSVKAAWTLKHLVLVGIKLLFV